MYLLTQNRCLVVKLSDRTVQHYLIRKFHIFQLETLKLSIFLAHQATTNKEVRSQIFIPRFDSEWRWLEISKYLSWHWHIRQANFAKGHRITIKFVQCTCMYIHTKIYIHTYIIFTWSNSGVISMKRIYLNVIVLLCSALVLVAADEVRYFQMMVIRVVKF